MVKLAKPQSEYKRGNDFLISFVRFIFSYFYTTYFHRFVILGAVLYGLDPGIVAVRRCRLTYGIGVLNKYDPEKHSTDKRVKRNKQEWCTDVFDTYVTVNQPVAVGDVVLRSYTPASSAQTTCHIHIYHSDAQPIYVSDEGVAKCGTLTLEIPESEARADKREIQIRMLFGDTEIKVSALDVRTGQKVNCKIDFMNE